MILIYLFMVGYLPPYEASALGLDLELYVDVDIVVGGAYLLLLSLGHLFVPKGYWLIQI